MATFFVKNGGSDAADGLSDANAWENISKVNSSTFSAGDIIQFNRGDTWREQLVVPSSGSSGNPITFGVYGTGSLPKILGSEDLGANSWTNESGDIWYATPDDLTVASDQPRHLAFDLGGTHHTRGTIEANKVDLTADFEFFRDVGNNRVYIFSTSDPATRYAAIEAAHIDDVIKIDTKDYITLENLFVSYGWDQTILVDTCEAPIIQDCEISFAGDADLVGGTDGDCIYFKNNDN